MMHDPLASTLATPLASGGHRLASHLASGGRQPAGFCAASNTVWNAFESNGREVAALTRRELARFTRVLTPPARLILWRQPATLALVLLVSLIAAAGRAESRDAHDKVQQGIRQFDSQEYAAASQSFDAALATSPENMRIVYNQACVAKARDDLDRAVELFQQAAISDDPPLASSCRYNLGVIAAGRARTTFGDKPEEADEEKRAEGLQQLATAVAHYRDCLSIDPGHGQARHNLELIRLWIKNMEQIWRERDRQRRRDEMDLMAFLRFIDAQQRGLRSTNRSLARLPDSPKRRHAVRMTATSQRELAEEIEPLKQKIEAAVDAALAGAAGATGGVGASGQDTDNEQEAAERREAQLRPLLNLTDEAGRQMASAATRLVNQELRDANDAETAAIKKLDELFMQLTDFGSLLQRAIDEQQTLVDRVAPAVEAPDEATPLDVTDLAWRQRFVTDWARMLQIKAKTGVARLAPLAAGRVTDQPGPTMATDEEDNNAAPAPPKPKQSADAQEAEKRLKPLKESMDLAIEHCSEVARLTGEAADHLDASRAGEALPLQEEALRLLREIAEPLRKQQEEEQEEKEKQDEEQDEKGDDNQPTDQPENQEDEKKQDQQQGSQPEKNPQRQPLTEKQLQALMQNIQERKRKRDENLKKFRAAIAGPGEVDKDW